MVRATGEGARWLRGVHVDTAENRARWPYAGFDVLRCQSPELIEKEVCLQAIAYNLVHALMLEAAWTHDVSLERLSFKGTVDTLRQWTPLFAPSMFAFNRARQELLRIIAADQVPDRPDRVEPRARKRRPKCYQLLTKPRRK